MCKHDGRVKSLNSMKDLPEMGDFLPICQHNGIQEDSMRFSTKLHCFDSALKLEQTESFQSP